MSELRPLWVCEGDGCDLRVRNADGRPIPEPTKWEDGLCIPCRVERERIANGQKAANKLRDRLMGIRRRPGPFGHRDPDFDADEPTPEKKTKPQRTQTAEEGEQIEAELRGTFDTDRAIADRVGVPIGWVAQTREGLGLPSAPERRVKARRQKLEEFLAADPSHMHLSAEAIAAAIGAEPNQVRADRTNLGLGVGRGHGKRTAPKPKNSHGGRRERAARLARVRAFVREYPNATNAQVAEALGLGQRRVQKDRYALRMTGIPGKHGEALALNAGGPGPGR